MIERHWIVLSWCDECDVCLKNMFYMLKEYWLLGSKWIMMRQEKGKHVEAGGKQLVSYCNCPGKRWKWSQSRSVESDSLRPHGLYSPWNSPGQNTGVGSLSLLQGIFPTQVSCIAGGFFTSWARGNRGLYWGGGSGPRACEEVWTLDKNSSSSSLREGCYIYWLWQHGDLLLPTACTF